MRSVERLLGIMVRLRDPASGCPWDVAQSFESIAPHTLEEAYEVDDAIRRGDMGALREELGDLLMQVVFHAQMARERQLFDFDAVADALADKLVRRHPNVFGDAAVENAAQQLEAWEELKARERAEKRGDAGGSALDDLALGLPALLRAQKLVRRAERAGLDAPVGELDAAWESFRSGSPDADRALGALLFALAAAAARQGIDAERALREANARFEAIARAAEKSRDAPAPKPPGELREDR